VGRYDISIPTRFLPPRDYLEIPAQLSGYLIIFLHLRNKRCSISIYLSISLAVKTRHRISSCRENFHNFIRSS